MAQNTKRVSATRLNEIIEESQEIGWKLFTLKTELSQDPKATSPKEIVIENVLRTAADLLIDVIGTLR